MKEKNKKIIAISVFILIIIFLAIIVYFNVGVERIDDNIIQNEITPQEEISDEQLRETMVSLYFINESGEITSEVRKIDSKVLLENPYNEAIKMLLEGPKSERLKSVIPKGVKVNKIEKKGDCVFIDFSKEFIDNQNDDVETHGKVINQIVNTMTQFSEINNVKISVEGKNNITFKEGNINFEQVFTREF